LKPGDRALDGDVARPATTPIWSRRCISDVSGSEAICTEV